MKKSKLSKVFSVCMEDDLYQFFKAKSDQHDSSVGEEMRIALRCFKDWEAALPGQCEGRVDGKNSSKISEIEQSLNVEEQNNV
jgi:hypothetical protein